MRNFCTLFDSHYLTKGLTMYSSLVRTEYEFTLYVVCFDDYACRILHAMKLPKLVIIPLQEFESNELKRVKKERSPGEYCWTCTPHVIRYVLETFGLPDVTYLDADLYFFFSPDVLFEEFDRSGGSILITSHRYTPRYDKSKLSGIYCVQFLTARADERGFDVLNWWGERCLEWCYARCEDGKFGDQKYLDDWPTRFQGVHVLSHLGGGIAPWNVQQYQLDEGPIINGIPIVFYHFHDLIWYVNNRFDLCPYRLSADTIQWVYMPYLKQLEVSLNKIRSIDPGFNQGIVSLKKDAHSRLRTIKRKLLRTYNIVQR